MQPQMQLTHSTTDSFRTRAQTPMPHHRNRPARILTVAAPSSRDSPPIPAPSSDSRPQSRHAVAAPSSRETPIPAPSSDPDGAAATCHRRSFLPQTRPQPRRRTTPIPARLGLPSATLAPSRRSAERPVAVSPPPPASCSIRPGELQHPSSTIDLRARYL